MRLEEVIRGLDDMPQHATAYVASETTVSPATPVVLVGRGEVPPTGWRYYLEILVMREVLWGWSFRHDGRMPSVDQACMAIIYYEEHDAHDPDD